MRTVGSQLDSHKSENYVIPLPAKIVLSSVQTLQNVKKPSLLKRTWSSRSRKNAAIHTTLEENRIPEFLIEENLAGVVEEINATIGLMNQYTLHNSLNYNPSLDVNGFADTTSAIKNESNGIEYYPREDECDDKWWVVANTESTHSFSDPNEFEPRWECFEHDFNKGQDTQETSDTTITECTLEAQAPVEVDTKTFIEAMEANIVSANLTLTLPEMEENRVCLSPFDCMMYYISEFFVNNCFIIVSLPPPKRVNAPPFWKTTLQQDFKEEAKRSGQARSQVLR